MSKKRNTHTRKSERAKVRRAKKLAFQKEKVAIRKNALTLVNTALAIDGMTSLRDLGRQLEIPYGHLYGNPPPGPHKLTKRIIARYVLLHARG